MRFAHCIVILMVVSFVYGCGGAERAQKRAYQAQEAVARERLRLVAEYQECIEDADADQQRRRACETYLKSADALN